MSTQTKCASSSSLGNTLSLSVISMFSLYWNVTALEAWNLFRVSCGLSAAVAFHMIFLKNYLKIPMMHTCKVNYIAYVCSVSDLCIMYQNPIGTSPSWDDSQLGRNPPTQLGRTQLGWWIPIGQRNGATNVPIGTIFLNRKFSLIDVLP